MDHQDISFDVSDIQLPPAENSSAPVLHNTSQLPPTYTAALPGYTHQQYWSYPTLPNYSAPPFYYPVNYFDLAQRFNAPVPVNPQYYYPLNNLMHVNPTFPTPIVQNQMLRNFQPKKRDMYRVQTYPSKILAESKPVIKRINRFYPDTWNTAMSSTCSPKSQANVIIPVSTDYFQQTNPISFKKKCKRKGKKNKSSLANELEKMKSNQEAVAEHDTSSLVVTKSVEWTTQHQSRVQRLTNQLNNDVYSLETPAMVDYIVGTCVELEKDFYRITSDIDPSKVRPQRILKKSLELVKEVWDDEGDYAYVSDQLKSIRQDLTVQGIRNNFAVSVYNAHARISLLSGDYTEFGQCLTQLRLLLELPDCSFPAKDEYICYYILNCIFTQYYTGIMDTIAGLDLDQYNNQFISKALIIQKAYQTCNFSLFFKTYHHFPGLGKHIIDWFIDSFRIRAFAILCHSYRQTIPVIFIQNKLGFSTHEKVLDFLSAQGAVFDGDTIDCKQTSIIIT